MRKKPWIVMILSVGLAALLLSPAPVWADGALILAGTPQVVPTPLVPGGQATVKVPVKTGKDPAKQVRLQIKLGGQVIGELTGGPLAANQTNTYEVKVTVPATAAGSITLTVWGQGTQIGQLTVQAQAPPPARPTITSISPATGTQGTTVDVTIEGRNLNVTSGGVGTSVGTNCDAQLSVLRQTDTSAQVRLVIAGTARPGPCRLSVSGPGSRPEEWATATLTISEGLRVTPGPAVRVPGQELRPTVPVDLAVTSLVYMAGRGVSGAPGYCHIPPGRVNLRVENKGATAAPYGYNLELYMDAGHRAATTLLDSVSVGPSLGSGQYREHTIPIPVGRHTVGPQALRAVVKVNEGSSGPKPVDSDPRNNEKTDSTFLVDCSPDVTALTPNTGTQGTTVDVTVEGRNLTTLTDVRVSGTGVTRRLEPGGGWGRRTLHLTIAAGAALGGRSLELVFPGTMISKPFTVAQTLAPMYVRNWSQYDVNEVWLVRGGGPGVPEVRELLTSDLSRYQIPRTAPGPGEVITRYNDEILIQVPKRHDLSEEPNVRPYYVLEYIQERVYFAGRPIYFDHPLSSIPFAPGVQHVPGYTIIRETLFILNHGLGLSGGTMFEQVLRGPDGRLYLYRPCCGGQQEFHPNGGHGPILLQPGGRYGSRSGDRHGASRPQTDPCRGLAVSRPHGGPAAKAGR